MALPIQVPPPEGPRFLSVSDAARILAVSEVTLYRAIRSGKFPAVKVRGRYVVPAVALDAMERAAVATAGLIDAGAWVVSGGAG
jgi:excisionase family DNA binding protein